MNRPNMAGIVVALRTISVAGCVSAQGGGQANNSPAASPAVAPVAGSPCDNAYYPVKAGAKWTYDLHTRITTSTTEVDTIVGIGPDSFTTQHDTGDGAPWTQSWTCTKDGLVQLLNKGGALSAFVQGDDGTATVTTKSMTGVTLPRNPKVGDTWSQSGEVVVVGQSVSATVTFTYSFKAVDRESVTVPAGTFDAMRIDGTVKTLVNFQNQTSMPTTGALSSWLVPGKGAVKSTTSNDITVATVDSESDLESYQIP